jgi:hypothetical protein
MLGMSLENFIKFYPVIGKKLLTDSLMRHLTKTQVSCKLHGRNNALSLIGLYNCSNLIICKFSQLFSAQGLKVCYNICDFDLYVINQCLTA